MSNFRILDLLVKKRDNGELQEEEVRCIVNGVTSGLVSQAQTGAMLMAMYLNGLSNSETVSLTRAMMESGEILTWPQHYKGLIVDKHSTGGVGDKVSIPLVPALAACGLKVPMISGRGLAHTGGTLDKLESIPGYKVACSTTEIKNYIEKVGACIVGQTNTLVPADKVMYATRDVTGTVENIPLIIASIMSKKAAEGLSALVLELTYGTASPLKTEKEVRFVATKMIEMSKSLGIKTTAFLIKMENPIGMLIGNALEVVESVRCIKGGGPPDLKEVVCKLGGQLLKDTGKADTAEEGALMIERSLSDGTAQEKFIDMLQAQGVSKTNAELLFASEKEMFSVLPRSLYVTSVQAEKTGFVHGIDALTCGKLAHQLGSGRQKPGETINPAVGVELLVQVGGYLEQGDVWAKVHHDTKLTENQLKFMKSAIHIKWETPRAEDLSIIVDTLYD